MEDSRLRACVCYKANSIINTYTIHRSTKSINGTVKMEIAIVT